VNSWNLRELERRRNSAHRQVLTSPAILALARQAVAERHEPVGNRADRRTQKKLMRQGARKP